MKPKLRIRKSFSVILLLFLSAVVCNSQDLSSKKTIDTFLTKWLIKKDIGAVKKNFAKDIFANKFLFAESCLGKPKQIKRATLDFLKEIAQGAYEKSLEKILDSEKLDYDIKLGELLSAPENDKYFLIKLNSNNLMKISNSDEDPYFYENLSYIKTNFVAKEYLFLTVAVKTKVGNEAVTAPIYLIWIQQNSQWKIIQFGMVCQ